MGEELQKYIVSGLDDLRKAVTENTAAIRGLEAEMREFKGHVTGRVDRLEKKESDSHRRNTTVVSILISSAALAVSIIANFFKRG